MDALFSSYLDPAWVDYLVYMFKAFPAGLLIGMTAWVLGYLVYALARMFKG